jgi:hypothetical protein
LPSLHTHSRTHTHTHTRTHRSLPGRLNGRRPPRKAPSPLSSTLFLMTCLIWAPLPLTVPVHFWEVPETLFCLHLSFPHICLYTPRTRSTCTLQIQPARRGTGAAPVPCSPTHPTRLRRRTPTSCLSRRPWQVSSQVVRIIWDLLFVGTFVCLWSHVDQPYPRFPPRVRACVFLILVGMRSSVLASASIGAFQILRCMLAVPRVAVSNMTRLPTPSLMCYSL